MLEGQSLPSCFGGSRCLASGEPAFDFMASFLAEAEELAL